MGANFGAQRFGVTPDLICFAKTVTNGVIPMGGVIVKQGVYEAFMSGPDTRSSCATVIPIRVIRSQSQRHMPLWTQLRVRGSSQGSRA